MNIETKYWIVPSINVSFTRYAIYFVKLTRRSKPLYLIIWRLMIHWRYHMIYHVTTCSEKSNQFSVNKLIHPLKDELGLYLEKLALDPAIMCLPYIRNSGLVKVKSKWNQDGKYKNAGKNAGHLWAFCLLNKERGRLQGGWGGYGVLCIILHPIGKKKKKKRDKRKPGKKKREKRRGKVQDR